MDKQEVLQSLRYTRGLPRSAINEVLARREEFVPDLVKILEHISIERNAELLDREGEYMGHLHAMFLLAKFRERAAYKPLIQFARLPEDLLESLCGDIINEDLGRILASVCGGQLAGFHTLIEDEDASEWARWAGLSGLVTAVVTGQATRDEVVAYFGKLMRGGLSRKYSEVWNGLVGHSADLAAAELLDDIRKAYDDDLVDSCYASLQELEEAIAKGPDFAIAALRKSRHHELVDDVASELKRWASAAGDEFARNPGSLKGQTPVPPWEATTARPGWAGTRIGRNDPCPCLSGKKFKKCCGK